jgi:hypothetical protein
MKTAAVTIIRSTMRRRNITDSFLPVDVGESFLRNVGSYKSHNFVKFQKTTFFIVIAVKTSILYS